MWQLIHLLSYSNGAIPHILATVLYCHYFRMPARPAIRTGKPLLKPDKYKEIIIGSLQYLTSNKQITLYAFVIMSIHIHLIWQVLPGKTPVQVQQSFMKYTAQQIKFDLVENHPEVLDKFRVNGKDRTYQFWERNSLGIELRTHEVFMQKLEYIYTGTR